MKIRPLTLGQVSYIPMNESMSVLMIPLAGNALQFDTVAAVEEYLVKMRSVDAFAHNAWIFYFDFNDNSWAEILKDKTVQQRDCRKKRIIKYREDIHHV